MHVCNTPLNILNHLTIVIKIKKVGTAGPKSTQATVVGIITDVLLTVSSL